MGMNATDFPPDSNLTGEIHSYAELRQRIHHDLRVQHPEWIEPNGDSPRCEAYERRLAELIDWFQAHAHKVVTA
jgi:hypothetical protein